MTNIKPPTEPVSIDNITFDALIHADETLNADVPAFPVETGFEVSDTIILSPIQLSMTVYLTNTPVTWRHLHGNNPLRVQEVIDKLKQLYFQKRVITVSTSETDYENMAITSISLPKKAGSSREISINFQQIRTVEAATATVPANLGRGGTTGVNAGTANTGIQNIQSNPIEQATQSYNNRGSILYNLASSSGLLDGRGLSLGGIFGS